MIPQTARQLNTQQGTEYTILRTKKPCSCIIAQKEHFQIYHFSQVKKGGAVIV